MRSAKGVGRRPDTGNDPRGQKEELAKGVGQRPDAGSYRRRQKTTEGYLHVSREKLISITSPLDDIWEKGDIKW